MRLPSLLLSLVSALALSPAIADEQQDLAAEGKALIAQYGASLKNALRFAVVTGGPAKAIGVCNTRAPEIAQDMSQDGWTIGRSSHRLRNPDNAPDAYTAAVIEDFLGQIADGAAPADLVATTITEENGQRVFRMVKAIPTAKLCLNCHGGDDVKPGIVARLAELYPEDQARNFAEGDMRGVFTLTKVLDD